VHGSSAFFNIVALDNLIVPKVSDFFFFVFLRLFEIRGYLLKIKGAFILVTVGHNLIAASRGVLGLLLELEIGDGLGSKVHLDRWLV